MHPVERGESSRLGIGKARGKGKFKTKYLLSSPGHGIPEAGGTPGKTGKSEKKWT
ncbi:hypothetical protein RUM43_002398, partial [Polyplax serrata]